MVKAQGSVDDEEHKDFLLPDGVADVEALAVHQAKEPAGFVVHAPQVGEL